MSLQHFVHLEERATGGADQHLSLLDHKYDELHLQEETTGRRDYQVMKKTESRTEAQYRPQRLHKQSFEQLLRFRLLPRTPGMQYRCTKNALSPIPLS